MKTRFLRSRAMTLMHMLFVIAIIIVLMAIAYPIWINIQKKKHGIVALNKMTQMGSALTAYIASNNNALPDEESADGSNDWPGAKKPTADKAWYNALPRQIGMQGVGDYSKADNPAGMYTDGSILYLPGADYPMKKRMAKPMYAYAFNGKLQRRPASAAKGSNEPKKPVLLNQVKYPDRTVALLEQGLRGEKKPLDFMKGFDGEDCRANGRQFIARSGGKGILVFIDGHAEQVAPADILQMGDTGGSMKWNADDSGGIFWTADPKDDPNAKDSSN